MFPGKGNGTNTICMHAPPQYQQDLKWTPAQPDSPAAIPLLYFDAFDRTKYGSTWNHNGPTDLLSNVDKLHLIHAHRAKNAACRLSMPLRGLWGRCGSTWSHISFVQKHQSRVGVTLLGCLAGL